MNRILAIETNIALYERMAAEWAKHNIYFKRVETMSRAIDLLLYDDDYLFIAVNEDSVPDYLSQLPAMREATRTPIFVTTSTFTIKKKGKALACGADVYDPLGSVISHQVSCALEELKTLNRLVNGSYKPPQFLAGGDIILSRQSRSVYSKGQKVNLTKNEFAILQCLMKKSGCVITHKQLLQEVWGEHYDENDTNILWRTINRLRGKLSLCTSGKCVKIVHGVGYVFSLG